MSDDEPMVSVKYNTYNKLREDLRETQNRNYVLEKELAAAKIADPTGTTQLLFDLVHELIKITQFAVGNLDPQTIAGWPYRAVIALAEAIPKIPGIDPHVKELPPELLHFAKLCAGYEVYRKERDANRVATAATAEDFGPKTAEAAVVHATYKAPEPAPVEEDAVKPAST